MEWLVIGGIVYLILRKRAGLPLLPAVLGGDPFAKGALLVQAQNGTIAAVPANTPATSPMDPHPAVQQAVASAVSMMSPAAAASYQQVLASSGIHLTRPSTAIRPAGIGSASQGAMGAWQNFDPHNGAGNDLMVDELGQPRSSSLSRPWYAR